MTHAGFEEALDLYAVGALDRQDRQALDVHLLSRCPSCHTALKEAQIVVSLLPYRLPLVSPPAELRATVLDALPQTAPQPPVPKVAVQIERQPQVRLSRIDPRAPWWARLLHPVVLVAAVVIAAAYAWSLRSQLPAEVEQRGRLEAVLREQTAHLATLQDQVEKQRRLLGELQGQAADSGVELSRLREALDQRDAKLDEASAALARAQQETAALRKGVGQRDEFLPFLQFSGVQAIQLVGIERAQSVGALLLFDPGSKKALFYVFNLPPLPAVKTYQLWAFTTSTPNVGHPISAGTFRTDAGAKGRLLIKSLPDPTTITRFALSVEPAGGRPQPSSPLLPFQRL